MTNILATTLIFLAAGCNVWSTPLQEDFGYVEVRKGANLFYLAYHVDQPSVNYADFPLIMWLQGGPGYSSVGYGNFAELGPYSIEDKMKKRQFAWTKKANVLFVDSPVSVGYSYAENKSLLCTNNAMIAKDLVKLLMGVYQAHPAYARMPLHIFGQSYGGKMAVEFAESLYKACKDGSLPTCPLRSVSLVNSWISPIDTTESWGPFLYNMGFVNANGLASIQSEAAKTRKAVVEGRWLNASMGYWHTSIVLDKKASNPSYYSLLQKDPYVATMPKPSSPRMSSLTAPLQRFMNSTARKARWGVPSHVEWLFEGSDDTFNAIWEDFMRPVVDKVAFLLDHSDVAVNVISGNLDLICALPGTYKWVEGMKWSGADAYRCSAHKPFYVKSYKSPAGFIDSAHNLTVYSVLRAGHQVPMDAPEEALELVTRIIKKDK